MGACLLSSSSESLAKANASRVGGGWLIGKRSCPTSPKNVLRRKSFQNGGVVAATPLFDVKDAKTESTEFAGVGDGLLRRCVFGRRNLGGIAMSEMNK